jgi:chromosome segregation ATPase
MDAAGAAEARERVTKWIEQTRQMFSLLPELLGTDSHVNERVGAAEREGERLRKEIEDLKRENHQLRAERDDIAQAMSQVAYKLGLAPRKSPFERTPGDHPRPTEPPKGADPHKAGEPHKAPDHPKA